MIYIFVFPVDGFERNAPDKKILDAYRKNKGVDKYTLDEFVAAINDDSVDVTNNWVRKIEDHEGNYPISHMNILDLEESGVNTKKISESDLWSLVGKLDDDYRELVYRNSLRIIASDMNLPEK